MGTDLQGSELAVHTKHMISRIYYAIKWVWLKTKNGLVIPGGLKISPEYI